MPYEEQDDVNDFLAEGGAPSFKFEKPGDSVTGTVVSARIQQQRDYDTNALLFWDDGNPKNQLIVDLQTDLRDENITMDDGLRRVYCRGGKGSALDVVRTAVRVSKGKLVEGGILTLTYIGDGVKTNPKFNAPKLYEAKYVPPTPSALSAEDLT